MLTQTAIRSDAFRVVPPSAHVPPRSTAHRRDAAARPIRSSRRCSSWARSMSYPRNTEIFGENEPADYVYKVVSGSVRTYKILSDGRRQIGGFYLPGDIFGLEFGDEHTLVGRSDHRHQGAGGQAQRAQRAGRPRCGGRPGALCAHRARAAAGAGAHAAAHQKRARARRELSSGNGRTCAGGNAIELPMSRQDIADYLGLTIETVSRTLTSLETAAAIEVPTSRRIVLRNRSALSRMNG